jgi:peptide/nickel transport system substrate-binding protein
VTPALAALLLLGQLDTLLIGTLAEPLTLDPHAATDLVSAAVVSSACEPLVRIRADGSRPEAGLATTWATRDSRTWTFTLRQGVRFHDGTPFDADAVVRNIERLRRLRGFPGRGERLGPHSVAIALEQPSAALLATLSQPFFAMQSPSALDDVVRMPVGTGAFRYVGARAGELELAASPEHWAGAPRVARLVFRRYPGQDALLQALAAGAVDVTGALGQDRVELVRQTPGLALESKTGVSLAFLSLNNERPPLQDRRVRQAIAHALDRPALVREVLGGHGEPARNPLPPSFPGYLGAAKELALDGAAARELLREAGAADGFETTLLAVDTPRPYLPQPMRVIERIRGDLARVGIRARLLPTAGWNDYIARTTRGDYDLAVLGWQADSPDANDFLAALLGSESIGATNRSRYASEAMDALLKRARRVAGPEQRASAYRDAQRLFRRDMPIVPLYHVSVFTAYRKAVHGLQQGPTGLLRFDKAWKSQP